MAKKHKKEEPENGERWLLTYADLITLLLGLFVILYSMSQTNQSKYQGVVDALSHQFGAAGLLQNQRAVVKLPIPSVPKRGTTGTTKNNAISSQLNNLLSKEIQAGGVNIYTTSEGISIDLLDFLLFQTGDADIRIEADSTLDKIAAYLNNIPNDIRVEGNTDNIPINTPQFPSNWHLSIARAMNTGYFLIQRGFPPKRLSIAGYSEYRPLVPNDSEANRAKNRRVEIVILNEPAKSTLITSLPDSLL